MRKIVQASPARERKMGALSNWTRAQTRRSSSKIARAQIRALKRRRVGGHAALLAPAGAAPPDLADYRAVCVMHGDKFVGLTGKGGRQAAGRRRDRRLWGEISLPRDYLWV